MTRAGTELRIQRQIVLPISKAIEIAYKSIRLRLSRSLLVTSGIVLALAFLMSVLCSDAMIGAMRAWSAAAHRGIDEAAAIHVRLRAEHRPALRSRQRIDRRPRRRIRAGGGARVPAARHRIDRSLAQ